LQSATSWVKLIGGPVQIHAPVIPSSIVDASSKNKTPEPAGGTRLTHTSANGNYVSHFEVGNC
jgi:hypothetical protein